jgi:hypothetical protein
VITDWLAARAFDPTVFQAYEVTIFTSMQSSAGTEIAIGASVLVWRVARRRKGKGVRVWHYFLPWSGAVNALHLGKMIIDQIGNHRRRDPVSETRKYAEKDARKQSICIIKNIRDLCFGESKYARHCIAACGRDLGAPKLMR